MKPIAEQTIFITGSTDGLGRKLARDLAGQGATVLLHGRNPDKGEAVLREIRDSTGNPRLQYYNADLASLAGVRRLADLVSSDAQHLDVLVNNAGIGARSQRAARELSSDGYELRFAVNYLAHYLLTFRLLPLLLRSAPARIVNVSSAGQEPIDFDNVMLEHSYDDLRAYRRSKLAQIMFTFDLAEELEGSGVTVNCLHPASLMDTKMVLGSDYFRTPLARTAEGVEAVEYAALSPELENVSGEYFNGKQRGRALAQAYDLQARRRLRELSDRLAGIESGRGKKKRAA